MGQTERGRHCPDALNQAGPPGVRGPRTGRSSRPPVHSGSTVGPEYHTLLRPDVRTPGVPMKRWCKRKIKKKAGWHLPSQSVGRARRRAGASLGAWHRRLLSASSPHPQGSGGPRGAGGGARGTWDSQTCQWARLPTRGRVLVHWVAAALRRTELAPRVVSCSSYVHSVKTARCHFSPGCGLSSIPWHRPSLQKPLDACGRGSEPWG